MEWNDRIAQTRKAAGLTQEQLGELVGVSRQAVSKWESGQTVPDALTVARLCRELHISADYILLGREPGTDAAPESVLPDTCPCCGRPVSGTLCPVCGYTFSALPPRGPRYAVVCRKVTFMDNDDLAAEIHKYSGIGLEELQLYLQQNQGYGTRFLLRRDLTDSAAAWITSHLQRTDLELTIVEDGGESEDALLVKQKAMELPDPVIKKSEGGIGFLGVVLAVIVALLILSLF